MAAETGGHHEKVNNPCYRSRALTSSDVTNLRSICSTAPTKQLGSSTAYPRMLSYRAKYKLTTRNNEKDYFQKKHRQGGCHIEAIRRGNEVNYHL